MNKFFGTFGAGLVLAIGFAGLLFLISLLFAWPTMALWNWVMVSTFTLPALTFWKAWGLLLLCGLLFKSSSVKS